MKKALLLTALIMTIVAAMVSGTLAVYTQDLTPYDTDVIAKEFVLLSDGTQNFDADVLIAPTETVTLIFTVQNFDGALRTEVPIDVDITVVFAAASGRDAIEPLTATLTGGNASAVIAGSLTDGVGTFTITDALSVAADETLTFEIEIEWPDTVDDIDFAGHDFATNVEVSVSGTQKI
jgi:hypothetical protein